jgi:hypothetical protein
MERCAERLGLADAVVKASARVSEVRKNGRHAIAHEGSGDEFLKPLMEALNVQRKAVSALEDHRKQHGC